MAAKIKILLAKLMTEFSVSKKQKVKELEDTFMKTWKIKRLGVTEISKANPKKRTTDR